MISLSHPKDRSDLSETAGGHGFSVVRRRRSRALWLEANQRTNEQCHLGWVSPFRVSNQASTGYSAPHLFWGRSLTRTVVPLGTALSRAEGSTWPRWAQPDLVFRLPATRPSDPPPRDCGVQRLRLGGDEFASAQHEPLGMEPHAELMLFAGNRCLVARPVLPRGPIRDQCRQPGLPPRLTGHRTRNAPPPRQHAQSFMQRRRKRPVSGFAATPLKPFRQRPFRDVV
jgi:hypothetical protein